MKFVAAAVTACQLAGVVGAPGRETGHGTGEHLFQVSNFHAGATPHSGIGYIEFSFGYGRTAALADCRASPSTYQVFPSVEQTVCSDKESSFNLTRTSDGGAVLALSFKTPPPRGLAHSGVYDITPEQIVWINQRSPTGMVQVYGGPGNFTVEAA